MLQPLGEVQKLLEAHQCVLVDLRSDRTSGRICGSMSIPSTEETPQGVKMPFFLQSLVGFWMLPFCDISIHLFYRSSVLYSIRVFRVHPMMCLGSTEGWRRMQKNGRAILW